MDKGVREARDLGDVGGIQSLVAGDSLGSLKLGTRSAVGKGTEVREGQRTQISKEVAGPPPCCAWQHVPLTSLTLSFQS